MNYAEHYGDMTILVTGGAGAIGSNLVRALLRAKARKVVVLDDLSSGYRWSLPDHPSLEVIEQSVLNDHIQERLRSSRPDYLFHLSALFANQNSIDHPHRDLLVNGMGTLHMLELARDENVRCFVYASSSSSFSKAQAPLPLQETFLSLQLDTPYQITKLLGEYYCNFFQHHWGVPTVRLRLFNSYGPGEMPGRYRNVIPNFMYSALQRRPLPITGTGEETRDFTYVEDVVDGLLSAGCSTSACGKAFNLASGKETRIIDLANLINSMTGNPAGLVFKERREWDHTSRRWASIDKARRVFGYEPNTLLTDGLHKTLEWFRENWSRIHPDITCRTSGEGQQVVSRAA